MARKPSKTAGARVESAERRNQILKLRTQHRGTDLPKLSLQDIADIVGIAKQSVHEHIQAALRERRAENHLLTDDVVEMQFDELQELRGKLATVQSIMEQAMASGDLGVIKSYISSMGARVRVQEREAKLLGLDAPTRTEITGSDGGPLESKSSVDVSQLPTEVLLALAAASGNS